MKKDNTIIKRFVKIAKNKDLKGYYRNETGGNIIICNNILMFKTGKKNIDFFEGIEDYTNKYKDFSYSRLNDFLINSTQDNAKLIEICINDLKIWKKHAEKRKPFVIQIAPNYYMGVNASYLLDLATLTRQDKSKSEMIEILIYKNNTPLTITGNNSIGMLCPIKLKDKYKLNDYSDFLDQLSECKKKEEKAKEEKAAKKANKAAGIIPTLQPNKNYNGFTMSFYGVDYFILSDAKRITKGVITEFVKAYCKRNNFSDTVLNDMLSSKIQLDNIKARIEKATFILNTNADNSAFTYVDIKTKYAFNGCMYFECDNKLVLIDCVLPTSTETKEETPKTATIQDNAADIVKADTVKDDTCTTTDTAATTETANNDSVTDTNNRKKVLTGFYMTFKNRDIFVATNEDTKRRYIVQAFINEMINISNHLQNITEEKRNKILNDEEVLNETKKRITPATIEEIWTSQENHIRITSDNNNMIVNHSLNNFKTIIIDCYSANEGITPTQETSFKFFKGISDINNRTTETMQADARQTETTQDTTPTQDKPHKTSAPAVSLFVVTDKPQPVKLPHLKPLNNIPMFQERFKTDFKQRNNARVYNNRVSNKKVLKKAYNDFVGTVSCYNDKCAISGGMVAVNSS